MNLPSEAKGLVTKKFNNFFYVDIFKDNNLKKIYRFLCKSRKTVFYQNKSIFVGDEVIISELNWTQKTAVIEILLERKNLFDRPSVANISDVYIVHSVVEPKLNFSQISQFLINAESLQVNVSLILTKCDLITEDKVHFLTKKFTTWGYLPRNFYLDHDKQNIDFINELKTKKCSILVGPSGVGKTTLLNTIIPDLNLVTAKVSKKIKRGRNTTRNIELFRLSEESYIVDTPGFNIHNIDIKPILLANLFPEFSTQIKNNQTNCKFRDCLHVKEPGCKLNKNFERYKYYQELIRLSKIRHYQTQVD